MHPLCTVGIIDVRSNIGFIQDGERELDLMALAARGAVTLHTQKYALDDFQTAISDLDAGRVRGRAILIP